MTATANLVALAEQLEASVTELEQTRAAYQTQTDEERTATATRLDEITTDIAAIKDSIKDNEKYFAPGADAYDPTTGKGWLTARAINAVVRGNFTAEGPAAYEYDVIRAQGLQVDSAGGFMLPENLAPGLIELLQARTLFNEQNLGITEMPGVGGAMKFNRVKTALTIGTTTVEGTTIPLSQLAIEQFSLEPKSCGVRVPISNLMLELAPAAAEIAINNQISRDMALKVDLWSLRGTGGSGQPLGILNDPDIGSKTVTDPAVTYEQLEDMVEVVELANVLTDSLKWAAHVTMRKMICRAVPTTSGLQVERIVLGAGPDKSVLGYPILGSTQFLATTGPDAAFVGDMSQILRANFKGLEISVTNVGSDTWEKDETQIRAIQRFDTHRLQPSAFCKSA